MVDRPDADQHLQFGGGVHACLGSHLARLQAELLVRPRSSTASTGLELAGEPVWSTRMFIRGLHALPGAVLDPVTMTDIGRDRSVAVPRDDRLGLEREVTPPRPKPLDLRRVEQRRDEHQIQQARQLVDAGHDVGRPEQPGGHDQQPPQGVLGRHALAQHPRSAAATNIGSTSGRSPSVNARAPTRVIASLAGAINDRCTGSLAMRAIAIARPSTRN